MGAKIAAGAGAGDKASHFIGDKAAALKGAMANNGAGSPCLLNLAAGRELKIWVDATSLRLVSKPHPSQKPTVSIGITAHENA